MEPEFLKLFLNLKSDSIFKSSDLSLTEIPTKFESYLQYKEIFYPLLEEETRDCLKTGLNEKIAQNLQYLCKLSKIQRTGRTIISCIQVEDKSHYKYFQAGTVVLISLRKVNTSFCNEIQNDSYYAFGIIISSEPSKDEVKIDFPVDHEDKSLPNMFFNIILQTPGLKVWVTLIQKFTSVLYSFIALQDFQNMHEPLKGAILNPSENLPCRQKTIVKSINHFLDNCLYTQSFDYKYNEIQKEAITWAINRSIRAIEYEEKIADPFTIIRGPPGTGKTHTLRYYQSFTAFLGRKNSLQNFSEGFIRKEEKNCGPREKIYIKPRILVCAPSNAAVNQICEKVIKVGFKQSDNMIYWPGIIRLAAVDALIPSDMKPILIQTKICSLLSLSETEWSRLYSQCYYNILALNQQIQNNNLRETVIEKIDQYIQSVEARDRDVADLGRLELVRTKYTSEFYLEKNASISKLYVELETSFVDEAEIVFTTLALCGRHTFRSISRTFDLLLIDEAAQANELTTLIPLTLGIKHCLLIGDNFQLPSTVISKLAKIAKFDRSLFQRLLENNYNFISLSIQYRMHPEICSFPSRFFYGGSLVDDPASSIKVQLKTNWPTAPYLLFDTTDTSELRGRSGSVVNVSEVHMIISILKSFMFMNPGTSLEIVAILTPYKEQKELIRNTLSETFGKSSSTVHISTIDGYQGKESDFVLISCVRAIKNIGFLSDAQRLNVAITRAKNRCWVLGNLSSLRKDRIWRYVVEDAVSRFCIIQGRESQAFLRSFFKCIKVL